MPILPKEFPEQPQAAIASYDWTDIAEGSGIVLYYAATTIGNNGLSGSILTTSTDIQSNDITLKKSLGNTTFRHIYDRNFDLTFLTPRIMKGTGFVNFTIGALANGGACDMNPIVTLSKVSGGTSTTLATISGSILRTTVNTGDIFGNYFVKRNLLTYTLNPTHFKKDDIFRCNIAMWTSGAYVYAIGCDPAGREDGQSTDVDNTTRVKILPNTNSGSSTFVLAVPFKVNL